MQIGMIGLGKMGANMARRLMKDRHEVIVFDIDPDTVTELKGEGAVGAGSIEELVSELEPPRAVWIMVPAGDITSHTVDAVGEYLSEKDIVVDGGNSRYTDTLARAERLSKKGIELVDAGTSGGIWGLAEGYCLMIGGSERAFGHLEPIFRTLAPENGYARVGQTGAGHYTKMVHNGIEYALMQAYGEGFEILHRSDFDIDVGRVAEVWRHGSVVRSWLLDLAARALQGDSDLSQLDDYVEDSGEGRWTVQEAIDNAIPAPGITLSLFARFASRQESSYAGKLIAALRREFGGHAVRSIEEGGKEATEEQ